jgi:glucokinase
MKRSVPPVKSVCCIGIDVGGTKIAAGLITFPEGRALAQRIEPTQPERGGRAVLNHVRDLARDLSKEAIKLRKTVAAIGVGICELVDREGNLVSANCIDWKNQPFREKLSAIAPTTIEADVRAAALAEALLGAGQHFSSFLYVTVGTGISCCLMLDGKPHLGAHGATGTMASSPSSVPCESCAHINQSTIEEISSGPALVKRFKTAGGKASTAQEVVCAASSGNSTAAQIVRTAAKALGSQIGLLINVLDPEAVIIGGGLGLSEGSYREHLIASTRRHIWSAAHRGLPILRAATGSRLDRSRGQRVAKAARQVANLLACSDLRDDSES